MLVTLQEQKFRPSWCRFSGIQPSPPQDDNEYNDTGNIHILKVDLSHFKGGHTFSIPAEKAIMSRVFFGHPVQIYTYIVTS